MKIRKAVAAAAAVSVGVFGLAACGQQEPDRVYIEERDDDDEEWGDD